MRVWMFLLLAFLWSVAPVAAVSRKNITLKEKDFSTAHLAKLAKRLLKGSSESFVQLNFLGAGEGTLLPKPTHYDFDQWRKMFELSVAQKRYLAEAVSINGNSVLRIHQPNGSVLKKILYGKDPTALKIGGIESEIVHFGFSESNRLGLQESVFVFVRSRRSVNLQTSVEVFEKLEKIFPGFGVVVVIRSDAWFIYEQRYPFFNPYNEDREVPSRADYDALTSVRCARGQDGPRCEIVHQ